MSTEFGIAWRCHWLNLVLRTEWHPNTWLQSLINVYPRADFVLHDLSRWLIQFLLFWPRKSRVSDIKIYCNPSASGDRYKSISLWGLLNGGNRWSRSVLSSTDIEEAGIVQSRGDKQGSAGCMPALLVTDDCFECGSLFEIGIWSIGLNQSETPAPPPNSVWSCDGCTVRPDWARQRPGFTESSLADCTVTAAGVSQVHPLKHQLHRDPTSSATRLLLLLFVPPSLNGGRY